MPRIAMPRRPSPLGWVAIAGIACASSACGQVEVPAFQTVPPPQAAGNKTEARPLQLKLVSDKANQVTDGDAWLAANRLELPALKVPNPFMNEAGTLPPTVPTAIAGDRRVVTASAAGERPFAIYGADFSQGDRLLLFSADWKTITHALDFSAWIQAPFRIQWVQVLGDTLYFSYGINGYAKEAGGKTAYLASCDLKSMAWNWRSEPLVSNSRNFLVSGGSLITGYGFTAEPDFLYVIDRSTGRTSQTVKVASGPEWLIEKGGQLHVRCYNRDYIFSLVR